MPSGSPGLSPDLYKQARALIDLAEVAHSLTNPDQQTQALTDLAETVGLPVACRLLEEAFAVGSWLIPPPVVAKLAPQVVNRVADAMYGDDRSRNDLTPVGEHR